MSCQTCSSHARTIMIDIGLLRSWGWMRMKGINGMISGKFMVKLQFMTTSSYRIFVLLDLSIRMFVF
jgi:hypothetical protein